MVCYINTRLLIISDTHAADIPDNLKATAAVDVAIHCGDLTEESKICEFRTTLDLLKASSAPLKIVIAGNHDWTLDLPTFRRKVKEAGLESDPALVAREYGEYGEVRKLFDEARDTHNIHLLDEGSHRFTLANGAQLTVYASPFTPSVDADWGFQYRLGDGHTWGARRVAWRENISPDSTPTHFTAIDNGKSSTIDSLQSYRRGKFDDDDAANDKAARLAQLNDNGYQHANLVAQNGKDECGTKTLFVNAAIQGDDSIPFHVPWVVNVPLRKAVYNKYRMPKPVPVSAVLRAALEECYEAVVNLIAPEHQDEAILVGGAASLFHGSS
ncbi:metallophosphoesterase domain-containing [Ophiostoma piceae UAMH 11346]|uniref:Metallophosphoesterase domain-containing n=1 Tax=Ophiostoma piceae (strain UAMH 11346) TaxID=1262450 RepID=S3C148_OPHP1|nr:metallophosphoesterase domain-containing [Ophiostoma piceae UAMH 11346]